MVVRSLCAYQRQRRNHGRLVTSERLTPLDPGTCDPQERRAAAICIHTVRAASLRGHHHALPQVSEPRKRLAGHATGDAADEPGEATT